MFLGQLFFELSYTNTHNTNTHRLRQVLYNYFLQKLIYKKRSVLINGIVWIVPSQGTVDKLCDTFIQIQEK